MQKWPPSLGHKRPCSLRTLALQDIPVDSLRHSHQVERHMAVLYSQSQLTLSSIILKQVPDMDSTCPTPQPMEISDSLEQRQFILAVQIHDPQNLWASEVIAAWLSLGWFIMQQYINRTRKYNSPSALCNVSVTKQRRGGEMPKRRVTS